METQQELSDAETAQLKELFKTLGVKPKTASPEDLRQWMRYFLAAQDGNLVQANGPPPPASPQPQAGNPAVTQTIVSQNPRISSFSGIVKGDQVSYEVWKYEVNSLKEEAIHSIETITIAARKSLRGEAAKVAMRLGVQASLDDLLMKLDGLYGIVEPSESLLAQFYAAKQHDDEPGHVDWKVF